MRKIGYEELKRILKKVNLRDVDLRCVDLRGSDLSNADLSNADLNSVMMDYFTIGYNLACPEEGSFIGYKKANNCLVKLLILEDSKRCSATSSKCRCDKAKVLEIIDLYDNTKIISEIKSGYDSNFIYKVGEIVKVDNFDENRWNECSTGIHFFMNKKNAINYK